ncbi:MAG: UDP-2,3-diacylglucosamine diphosphatase LpxI [Rickettsiales bacterium]|nr:UDP-2,3-diacylglucosamine diphosphatase LpxI [Rickettsiales bacterium]
MNALGIVAGSGALPRQLIEACRINGRPVFVIGFERITDPQTLQNVPHATVRLGAVGDALSYLRQAQATDIVFAGRVQRPSMTSLMPDATGARMLAHIGTAFFAGDDALLRRIVSFLEKEGFRVVGSEDILTTLVTPEGVMGTITPDDRERADIMFGMQIAKKLGELDIGQAVVVENGYVLGVEAAEGTDALIKRCGFLKKTEKGGVLVKVKKPTQDSRVDLPAIGIETIERASEAGLRGIAVETGGSLILEQEKVVKRANELGLFLIGIHYAA